MRSLPSCLGGGDLDGDLYNIITLPALHPERCVVPAAYTPAVKKTTDYPCTIHDVADFIVDFINSDIIGLIAIQHLIISDQSPKGVEDPRCILLAELHSDAVDFPKSGTPVPLGKVPKLLLKIKPDWSAGEMSSDTAKFHKSAKALGQLYRAVQLTDPHGKDDPKSRGISKVDVDRLLRSMDASVRRRRNPISSRLRGIVGRYVDMDYTDDMLQAAKAQFVQYEMELRHICASHNLSQKPLKEAEAFVGTITAKSSQP
jgi:RNA-dependent RNA polymerase